jgi:hypothetical protein
MRFFQQAARSPPGRAAKARHLAAIVLLSIGAVWNASGWIGSDRIPLGDHAGYVASVLDVRAARAAYGEVPSWRPEIYAGTSQLISTWKEDLVLPLFQLLDPIAAYLIALVLVRWLAAVGMYALVVRSFGAPALGVLAGYAYGFGAIANQQTTLGGHLDFAIASALLAPTLLATVAALRDGRIGAGVMAGVLAALQLRFHFVTALAAFGALVLLALLPPWSRQERASPRLVRVSCALGVATFALLSASPIAWFAFEGEHHPQRAGEFVERSRARFTEASPFLLVNRANFLGDWIDAHHPPSLTRFPAHFAEHRYLGIVPLAVLVLAAGVATHRARRATPRAAEPSGALGWAPFCGALFAIQYGLAMGPHSLLWLLVRAFGGAGEEEDVLRSVLLGGAAVSMTLAAVQRVRRRPGAGWLLATGLAAAYPCVSLFALAEFVLPPLRTLRAPSQFFYLAPFAFYLGFAAALAMLVRASGSRTRATLAVGLVGVLLVWDFAPSREAYQWGSSAAPVRAFEARLRSLDAGDPPARLGIVPLGSPSDGKLASLASATGAADRSWGWVTWQATRNWPGFYQRFATAIARSEVSPRDHEFGLALARLARIRFLLEESPPGRRMELPAPWRRLAENEIFALWERGPALPAAFLLPSSAFKPDLDRAGVLAIAALRRPLRYARPAPDHIQLTLDDAGERTHLVVSEAFHPWWRADVDGEAVGVKRAFEAFLSVPLAPGARNVALRFEPPAVLYAADAITLGGWVAVVLAGIFAAIRTHKRAPAGRA